MFNFRYIITVIVLVFFSMTYPFLSPVVVLAKDAPPPIAGEYGAAIDAVTGDILYNKNADDQAYPASMTKVLTAIILDEKIKDNQMLTVSPNAAGQECICFGLKAGEQISKKDAMYGMLLLSANDLAVTVAENAGGSVRGFAQLMNKEVKRLGLTHTHFVTPNGLHDPDHYTTAHDMALIMKEALKHPEVLNALSTQTIQIHTSLQDKTITNTSRVHIQPMSAHVIAGKNGYTDQAEFTLVEYLKKGNKEVIAVVMKTPDRKDQYHDIQTMANYAFAQLKTKIIASKGDVVENVQIKGEKVGLIASDDITVTLKSSDLSQLATKIDFVRTKKEIKKGQVAADLKVLINGKMIKEVPLITDKVISQVSAKGKDGKSTNSFTRVIMIWVGILIVFYLFARWTVIRKRKKRKRMISK